MSIAEQSAKVLAEVAEHLAICENSKPDEIDRALTIQIIERRKRRISSGLGVSVSEQEISAESPILGACAVCHKSLRCLKTAIEGLLFAIEQAESILNINWGWDGDCGASARAHDIKDSCEDRLTSIITQWNENK